MTTFDYFSWWAWGHIQDYYRNEQEVLFTDIQNGSILVVISKCAQEALCDFDPKEQEEVFGFTLEQIDKHELIESFYVNELLMQCV